MQLIPLTDINYIKTSTPKAIKSGNSKSDMHHIFICIHVDLVVLSKTQTHFPVRDVINLGFAA